MSHNARLKAIERRRGSLPTFSAELVQEVETMVSHSLKDEPPFPDNRLDECQPIKEIEAELERIVYEY